MEEQSFAEKLLFFLKQHILIVVVFSISTLLLVIGLIQILSTSSSDEVTYISASSQEESTKPTTNISKLMIDVSGAVEKPGVYEISSDSRLKDAILKAGGFLDSADKEYISKAINLAQKLVDGEKIYIPFKGEEGIAVLGLSNDKISINKASSSELESLPGVGSVTAEKIIKGRPFNSFEELVIKKVVSKSVFEKIKDEIRL